MVNLNKKSIFKYLYRLHIYGGLFCSVYLFIVGLSALNIQHEFLPEYERDTVKYKENITFDKSLEIDTLAKYISLQLGIVGHLPPWDYRDDGKGNLSFKIHRPARIYKVDLERNSDVIHINEIHFSSGKVLNTLHKGSIGELDDPMIKIWAFYAQLATLFGLIAVGTSIYFWFKKSIKSRQEWFIVITSGTFSILYILYIWLIG